MTTPHELKSAEDWEENIVLTSSNGIDHVSRLNRATIRAIQDDAIRWAAAQKPAPMNELEVGEFAEGYNDACDDFAEHILKQWEERNK